VRPLVPRAPDFADLAPELDQQPSDILVTKQCPGAFAGTGLNEVLQKRGVTQIFLAGISTSFGVESTARNAYDFGYNVVFIAEAMTDRDAATHQHCVEKIFPRLGEIDTTANVLKLLGAASGTNGGFNPDRTRGNA
jgi:nicotinamidase-related amidase